MRAAALNTSPPGGAEALPGAIRRQLAETRARTLELVAPVSEENMNRVHDGLMSPLVWDLGHIAAYEDLWIAHRHAGLAVLRPELMEAYDAFETPRSIRGEIELLSAADAGIVAGNAGIDLTLEAVRKLDEKTLAGNKPAAAAPATAK